MGLDESGAGPSPYRSAVGNGGHRPSRQPLIITTAAAPLKSSRVVGANAHRAQLRSPAGRRTPVTEAFPAASEPNRDRLRYGCRPRDMRQAQQHPKP